MYIAFEKKFWDRGYDGAVKVVNNADIDRYKYSGYGIGFHRHETFSVGNGFCRNVMIFGVDVCACWWQ